SRPDDNAQCAAAGAANRAASKRHRRADVLIPKSPTDLRQIEPLGHSGGHLNQKLAEVQNSEGRAGIDYRHGQDAPKIAVIFACIILQSDAGGVGIGARIRVGAELRGEGSELAAVENPAGIFRRVDAEPDIEAAEDVPA